MWPNSPAKPLAPLRILPSIGNAAADAAGASVEVDVVADPAARTEKGFRHEAGGCVVCRSDRELERRAEHGGKRHVVPVKVRGQHNHAVLFADQAGNGQPDADRPE